MTFSVPPEFKKISILLKLYTGCSQHEITGFSKDTTFKLWGCFMASRLTGATNYEIAKYFQIDPEFMKKQLQGMEIGFLVFKDSSERLLMQNLLDAYRDLQAADATTN